MAGRLLIACLLSARADHASQQEETILQAVRASSMLLHHMVAVTPIALGSSEVLDETCRGKILGISDTDGCSLQYSPARRTCGGQGLPPPTQVRMVQTSRIQSA